MKAVIDEDVMHSPNYVFNIDEQRSWPSELCRSQTEKKGIIFKDLGS